MMSVVFHFLHTFSRQGLFRIVEANPTPTVRLALRLWYSRPGGGGLIDANSSSLTSVAPLLKRCLVQERSVNAAVDILRDPAQANMLFRGFTMRFALLGGLVTHEQIEPALSKKLIDTYIDVISALLERDASIWSYALKNCSTSGLLKCFLEISRLPDRSTTGWILAYLRSTLRDMETTTERMLAKVIALVEGEIILTLHQCLIKHDVETREFRFATEILNDLGCYLPYASVVDAIYAFSGEQLLGLRSLKINAWDTFLSDLKRCKRTLTQHDLECFSTCCDNMKVCLRCWCTSNCSDCR